MAAVAPLPVQRPDRPTSRPPLRLVPRPRKRRRDERRHAQRRDAAFAAALALLLGVGIVAVLLLNTMMQTQADRIAATRQHLADLSLKAQVLQTEVDRAEAPGELAARARALHLRPATKVAILRARSARLPHQTR